MPSAMTEKSKASAQASVPGDPLSGSGIREFGLQFRAGKLSAEQAAGIYLDRIAALDPTIQAFHSVDREAALAAARQIDALYRSGTDLGPLMGVPVAVKEIFRVDGFAYGAGTAMDLSDITPVEGPFISNLRKAGCVILGTTHTTEFAAATINVDKPMPWNPADESVKRVCGGSSHGSAAALRAGLCAFSVGSDTGGSVRLPAAMCGVVGYKSTAGLWPTDGVFALSPTLDSVGVFTRSAADAELVFSTLEALKPAGSVEPSALRLGRPGRYVFEQLDEPVRQAVEAAIVRLKDAGVRIVDVDTPDIAAAMPDFVTLLFGEFVAVMGEDRLRANRHSIDRVPWGRFETAFAISPRDLLAAQHAQRKAVRLAKAMMANVDALIYPSAPFVACPAEETRTLEASNAWNVRSGRLTRPGNYFGQCGISIPVQDRGQLPIGLQLIGKPHDDAHLLAVARCVEAIARPSNQF